MREPLTPEDVTTLSKHAGELGRQIELKIEARKEAAKVAAREIQELQAELRMILEWLRSGFREIEDQMELPTEDRIDHLRDIVRKRRAEIRGEAV